MTPLSYASSTSSTTSASFAGRPTIYISTMYFYGLAVETMFGRTSSPSATTVTLSTTKGSGSGWLNT